jgi:hypothetical protein
VRVGENHEKVYTPVHTVKGGIQLKAEKKFFTKKNGKRIKE